MNKARVRELLWRFAALMLCAVVSFSVFTSCDEAGKDDGNYKEPSGVGDENGSDEGGGGGAENGDGDSSDAGNAEINGGSDENGLPTVEFPAVPFD